MGLLVLLVGMCCRIRLAIMETLVLSGRIIDNNNKEHLMELYNSDAICDVVVLMVCGLCSKRFI